MTRQSMYRRCLLSLVHVLNLVGASLHRIQYQSERVDRDARVIARCASQVTRVLFEPSNRVVVIVPDYSTPNNDSIFTDKLLKILANNDKIDNTLSVINAAGFQLHTSELNRDSSYIIMTNDLDYLQKIFLTEIIPKWSEYLIITKIIQNSIKQIAISLRKFGFLKLAFLHIGNKNRLPVLQTFEDVWKNSSSSDEPEMKALVVCQKNNSVVDIPIRPFSSILCPAEGCYLTVGYMKNDMVGSAAVAKTRRVFDAADHIVSIFAKKYRIELKNRSIDELDWTETVDLIRQDEIDMTYGSFIPKIEGLEFIDIATWYGFETMIFVDMMQITILPPLSKIFFPLSRDAWLCLFLLLGCYSIFALIVQKAHKKKLITDQITYFDVWAILLSQGVKSPFKIGLRVVIGMWLLASLFINAAYSSAFKSTLVPFAMVETLKTLNDINDSGRWIAGTEVARELFNNSDEEADRRIYERWRVVPSDEIFSVVMLDRIVGVDYVLNVKLHNLLHRKKFQPHLYTLKDPILVYPLNFYLKKSHPYIKQFRNFVIRIRASGLVEKWNVDNLHDIEERVSRNRGRHRWRWNGKMRLRQLRVAFKLWGFGNFIAFLIFLFEQYKSRKLSHCMRSTFTVNKKQSQYN